MQVILRITCLTLPPTMTPDAAAWTALAAATEAIPVISRLRTKSVWAALWPGTLEPAEMLVIGSAGEGALGADIGTTAVVCWKRKERKINVLR
jgi:hypothetical protein